MRNLRQIPLAPLCKLPLTHVSKSIAECLWKLVDTKVYHQPLDIYTNCPTIGHHVHELRIEVSPKKSHGIRNIDERESELTSTSMHTTLVSDVPLTLIDTHFRAHANLIFRGILKDSINQSNDAIDIIRHGLRITV